MRDPESCQVAVGVCTCHKDTLGLQQDFFVERGRQRIAFEKLGLGSAKRHDKWPLCPEERGPRPDGMVTVQEGVRRSVNEQAGELPREARSVSVDPIQSDSGLFGSTYIAPTGRHIAADFIGAECREKDDPRRTVAVLLDSSVSGHGGS